MSVRRRGILDAIESDDMGWWRPGNSSSSSCNKNGGGGRKLSQSSSPQQAKGKGKGKAGKGGKGGGGLLGNNKDYSMDYMLVDMQIR